MPNSNRRKELLITGCGRSGTRYMVALLERHGLEIKHEEMGRNGIVSWCMAVDSAATPWGPPRRDYDFNNIFQQVRSPLKAIPSITKFKDISWQYIGQWIPCRPDEPVLLRAAKYWYYWNEHAENIAHWRYRIETFPEVYPEFCERLGLIADTTILESLDTDINTRARGRLLHLYDEFCLKLGLTPAESLREKLSRKKKAGYKDKSFSWHDLEQLDSELCDMIRTKAESYGYID